MEVVSKLGTELAALEEGSDVIEVARQPEVSLIAQEVEIKNVAEGAEEELARLVKEHPYGELFSKKIDETIEFFESRGRLQPIEGVAPDEDMELPLAASEETFEMLVRRGFITKEMAQQKRANLAAIVFLKLYRSSEYKSELEDQNGDLLAQIILNKSHLYFQNKPQT